MEKHRGAGNFPGKGFAVFKKPPEIFMFGGW
jgi:hypothetical protein